MADLLTPLRVAASIVPGLRSFERPADADYTAAARQAADRLAGAHSRLKREPEKRLDAARTRLKAAIPPLAEDEPAAPAPRRRAPAKR